MIEYLKSTPRTPSPVADKSRPASLKVCLINPRFEPAFYNYDFALPMFEGDKRHWMASGALPLLAALAPGDVDVELVDENIREIDFEDLRRFDVIGVSGMIVQRQRMFEILRELEPLPATIVAGGAYMSICENEFVGRCDVRFVGEADDTWPEFLRAAIAGEEFPERYEQLAKTDVTKLPVPRYDLLDMPKYMSVAVQFSRGCPFQCEFCDIITIFGRRPRVKTPEQLIADMDAARLSGAHICFLVDDNFIGNKVAAKKMLPHLIEWQRRHGFPLQLSTEASVNIADEPELMELMVQANFRSVFIGLESPRAASLQETKKFQNTTGDTLPEKVQRVRDAGLIVSAGFMVGFDNDDVAIFEEQFAFIRDSGIGQASLAILSPLPTTPLYDRLLAEGRLDDSDPEVAFIPAKMTQRELREGHTALMRRLYEPAEYLERVFAGYRSSPAFRRRRERLDGSIGRTRAIDRARRALVGARVAVRMFRTLVRTSTFGRLAPTYLQYYLVNLAFGRDAMPLNQYMTLVLTSWHFFNMVYHKRKMTFGNPALEARAAAVAG